jgi:hypothetical protein
MSSQRPRRQLTAAQVLVRFVYDGGVADIKGEWVTAQRAWENGFMMPNENYRVKRIEFEQVELPPRVRQEAT